MGLQLTGQDSLDSQASVLSEASTSSTSSSCTISRGPHKCLAILHAQSLHVVALALSGEFLYAGSNNGEIRAWDHPDMQEGTKFGHGEAAVKCLVVIDNQIISAHQDHKVRVWRRSKSQLQEHRLVTTLPSVKDYIVNFLPSKNYVQVRYLPSLSPCPYPCQLTANLCRYQCFSVALVFHVLRPLLLHLSSGYYLLNFLVAVLLHF